VKKERECGVSTSLPDHVRSKRFRRFFRPFEAFSVFWRRKNWGEHNTDDASRTLFVLAPIFARSKTKKCFKPAESPTEKLATQASFTNEQGG